MTSTLPNTLRHLPRILAAVALLGGCGNYSNEDVDFQLAVPKREDLSARLPQALVLPEAAEYYRMTHQVGTFFNLMVVELTGLVDFIRSHTPSGRNGEERIWGPYPVKIDPSWEVRLRMAHAFDLSDPGFRYVIEFHRTGDAADSWQPLMTGTFGIGRGQGELVLDLGPARQSGYPIEQYEKPPPNQPQRPNELLRLILRYQRRVPPMTVDLTVENIPGSSTPGATYRYQQEADGSGGLVFVLRFADSFIQALEVRSRWSETGAGRADARLVQALGGMGSPIGVDCWGPDGLATFVLRTIGARREEGSAGSCIFGPL